MSIDDKGLVFWMVLKMDKSNNKLNFAHVKFEMLMEHPVILIFNLQDSYMQTVLSLSIIKTGESEGLGIDNVIQGEFMECKAKAASWCL